MKHTKISSYEINHKEFLSILEAYILSKDPSAHKIIGSKLLKTLRVAGVEISSSSGVSLTFEETHKETP